MRKYYISTDDGRRLDLAETVSAYLNKTEREALQLIGQGSVWDAVSPRRLKDPRLITAGMTIKVNMPEKPVMPFVLDPDQVVYEDENLMAVYKGPGVSSHSTPYSDIDSLAYGVAGYLKKCGESCAPSIINRLDKPTGGLLLFAKDGNTARALHAAFRDRVIRKTYLVFTEKHLPERKNIVIRDTLEWNGKAKDALTYVRYLGDAGERSCFLAFPRTGRTHQIRKHFAENIRPVKGDMIYGGYGPGDLELLCCAYSFVHPVTGKQIRIRHMPSEYRRLLGSEA